ncbi:MAG: chemotaxis protein CheB [Halieaceae bacterium]
MSSQPFIGVICDASFSVLAGRIKGAGYRIARIPPRMLVPGELPPVDVWVVDCADDDQVAEAMAWMETPLIALSNRPDPSNPDKHDDYQAWCARIIKTLDKWTANTWHGDGSRSNTSARSFRAVEGVWVLAGGAGGIGAVCEFLEALHFVPPVAFVYAQHSEADQRRLLTRVTAANSQISCELAMGRHWLNPHQLLVVPSTCRLEFGAQGEVYSVREPWSSKETPNIDHLMMAMTGMRPAATGAIIFSGAGCDGCEGGNALLSMGARVWAQDPGSAEVSAMPSAAMKLRLADHAASPQQLAADFLDLYPQARSSNF